MHDEHDLKYNIQLNGGATPHTFTTTHTWRRTLAQETLMGATSWLKGCSWQPRSRDTDGRHHGSKAFMVVRPHAPRHDDAACDELLTAHTTHTTYIVTHPGSIGAGGSVCTHTRTCIHTKTAHTRTHAHALKTKYMASPPLCSERNGMTTPYIAPDTHDIHTVMVARALVTHPGSREAFLATLMLCSDGSRDGHGHAGTVGTLTPKG